MYRYKDVIKAFIGKNKTCVWNWSLIPAAVKKWDSTCLGKLLSTSKTFGPKAVRQAASNLQQLLQDARNVKRNIKTGARTPAWMMEIVEAIDLGPERKQQRSGSDDSHQVGNALTIEESRSDDCHPEQSRLLGSGPRFKRKRTLKLSMSTTSEEPPSKSKASMLAIEDKPPNEEEWADSEADNIEDTNSEPFKYAWDDVNNKGKRMKPGGRWQTCSRQTKDRASGFMKCFWKSSSGEEESWISEMTILEYESNEPDEEVKKKPAGSVLKRPAAVMKRPGMAKK